MAAWAMRLQQIEQRVRSSICDTYSSDGTMRREGRISEADLVDLLTLLGETRAAEQERCASLHESVNPASDDERSRNVPGAGAMGAVIEYRDLIRRRQP